MKTNYYKPIFYETIFAARHNFMGTHAIGNNLDAVLHR